MKQTLVLLFICCSFFAHAQKAVFIIADGIPPDVLENISTPQIDNIAAAGTYVRAHVGGDKGTYSETPTISAVGYNSLLTGTWVNKHNVWDNDIKAPDYNYPTIFKLFKEQYPHKKTAIYSSWLDNRTKLVGDNLAATGHLTIDFKADGFELDTIHFPHDRQSDYMHRIDETVVDKAVTGIRNDAPDLSWVYLEYTDDMGHRYGDSPQMNDAVVKLDKQVGKIWEAIRYRENKFGEKWLIIITTDHGRDEKTGRSHGGQSARQRSTWMVSNQKLNQYAQYNYPAIVDIMPTLAAWLKVSIPADISNEIDGISLLGKVSIAQPTVNIFQHKADITWQVLEKEGNVGIWLCTTNKVKEGGKDEYILLRTVPVSAGHCSIDIGKYPSPFYKIVLKATYNTINTWFLESKVKD